MNKCMDGSGRPRLRLTRRGLLQGAGAAALGNFTVLAHGAEAGVSDTVVRIGQSTALTGPLSGVATTFTEGAFAYFARVNSKGGVHGRKIQLVTKDDGYVPERSAENTKALLEEGILGLFGILGVPNTLAALPVATQAQAPFLFPLNGDPHIRRTANRFLFTATASFEDEIDRLVEHVASIGARRISVAHLSNAFGKSILEAAELATKRRGLTLRSSASFDLQGDRTKAARDLAATSPDALILGAVASSAADFIRAFRATGSSAVLLLSRAWE